MRVTSALASIALLMGATSAMALQAPVPGKEDPRMQSLSYSPGQIYFLHLKVGHTLAITLPPDETRNETYGSDSVHLKTTPVAGTNLVFAKPVAAMPAKSFFIHAVMPDGSSRLYTFKVDVVAADGDSADPYTLTFRDPAAAQAAKVAAWRVWKAREDEKTAQAALAAAANNSVDKNFQYVLQGKTSGDWNLLPTRQVSDDGTNTHFHFPGQHSPIIYVVSGDGKETVPDCTPNSETHIATCHQLAARWRLRDGDAELCISNVAYDPIGVPTPSNTSSPDYERMLKVDAIP
jgi:type IV secretion system protein VirB9